MRSWAVTSGVGGSSPLTRGKQVDLRPQVEEAGLIPAHAGKTTPAGVPPLVNRAHPRSRGENYATQRNQQRPTGSSPLTRGKLNVRNLVPGHRGLIPAHAGKTSHSTNLVESCGAHPRSRGENTYITNTNVSPTGSSPLTRGKPEHQGHDGQAAGLIPAHAGKTMGRRGRHHRHRAHPRSRGENSTPRRASPWTTGSSPLTRGKLAGV